jgi:Holliday junction resolvase
MPGRRARRVDGNQPAIVDALRRVGFHVEITSHVGCGYPDLTAARGGRVVLVEVKDPSQPPNKRKLTPDEARVHAAFKAKGVDVAIVETIEQAVRL